MLAVRKLQAKRHLIEQNMPTKLWIRAVSHYSIYWTYEDCAGSGACPFLSQKCALGACERCAMCVFTVDENKTSLWYPYGIVWESKKRNTADQNIYNVKRWMTIAEHLILGNSFFQIPWSCTNFTVIWFLPGQAQIGISIYFLVSIAPSRI